MGCHTWFYRPLKDDERELLRSTVDDAIKEFLSPIDNPGESYIKYINKYKYVFDKAKESAIENTDFWLENHIYNSDDSIYKIEGKFYVELARPAEVDKCLLNNDKYFHDIFRVRNYPRWVIHNKRELRRKMKKKYFDLSQEQLDIISDFFKTYPGGVIDFG